MAELTKRQPMVHLRQTSAFDCGVTSLAMITRLSPAEIEDRLGYSPQETRLPDLAFGVLEDECTLLLHQLRRSPVMLWTRELHTYEGRASPNPSAKRAVMNTLDRRKLILSSKEVMEIARGHEAIFSAVRPGQMNGHMVAFDGEQVLDPSPATAFHSANFGEWHIFVAIIAMRGPA